MPAYSSRDRKVEKDAEKDKGRTPSDGRRAATPAGEWRLCLNINYYN